MNNEAKNNEVKNNETKLFKDFTPDKMLTLIRNNDLNSILNNICRFDNQEIYIDYRYFKPFASKNTYEVIINCIISNINAVLSIYDTFIVHVCMKSLSVIDAEKHSKFIYNVSNLFKEKYPDKLNQCFIYNAPFIFSKVYDIIRPFIDKETQKKVIMFK